MNKKEFFKVLGLEEYISVDLETTGLKYNENRITEIGIALIRDGEIAETREWIVDPQQEIPDHIVRLTGITPEMVKGKPTFEQIADELLDFIKNRPIVGQNVIFDINFLEASFRRINRDFSGWSDRYKEYHYITNTYYDTAYLARLLFPFFERHALQHLAGEFEYKPDAAHRALEDAKTAAFVFTRLIENLVHLTNSELHEIVRIIGDLKNPFSILFENFLKFRNIIDEESLDAFDWQHSTREQYNILGKIAPKPIQVEATSTSLLDKEEIHRIFSEGGILSQKLNGFESRQPQIEMVDAVVDAFNNGQILSVEAGTGTGKSFAYLVPAIKWIEKNRKRNPRIVISTNTKNLQEQLFYKDLPLLKAILNVDFSAVLLKGKSNYLCLDKYNTIIQNPDQRLSVHEKNQAALLVHWKHLTSTGDISDHRGFIVERNLALWRKFIAEDKYCPGKSCSFYDDCHIMRIRQAARNADIVVVNHALLCSDLVSDNQIIGEYDFLIIDEAHNLEKTAIDYLGAAVNFWEVREALEDLYNHDKQLGLLAQIENSLRLADCEDEELKSTLLNFINERKRKIQMAVVQIREEFQKFGTFFNQHVDKQAQDQPSNVTVRIKSGDEIATYLQAMWANIRPKISPLISDLMNFSESFRNLKGELKYQDQQYQELLAKINRLETFRANFDFVSVVEHSDHVYWVEANTTYSNYDYRFYASPLRIDRILYDQLFSKLEAGILTSATITVNNQFDYFYSKMGLKYLMEERRAELSLTSPFNYNEQAALLVPLFFSSPTNPEYRNQLRDLLVRIIDAHEKGTLVLFTAYGILKATYNAVKDDLKSRGVLLLGQGIDGSRHHLIRQFKEEKSSVLFGTDSFWEGIDVPGEALEILVITRLPFEVPSDPVVEAKCELIEQEGRNSFMEYMLPESIIKLKQGFGRLIRTQTDKGIVIITDNRIMTKKYGSIIRRSLPVPARSFYKEEEFYQFIHHWFEKRKQKSGEILK